MKLDGYAMLKAKLRLKSGLHIGTGEKVERGEVLPVMESRTGAPYIPGSSIKGKMRSLLELTYGRPETDPRDPGSPCWCGRCQVCILFGSGSSNNTFEPSRLIFRDCYLTETSEAFLERVGLENKPGVRIDRTTGKAASGAFFPMARVPEGSEFEFQISTRLFEKDIACSVQKWLLTGLYLIEQDAIGGGGTRGSGHVEFYDIVFGSQNVPDNWRDDCGQNLKTLGSLKVKED